MARAIQKADFPYEINDPQTVDTAGIKCLISMDKFNIGTDKKKVNEPAASRDIYPFHISLDKNENKYGIHPRHIVGEYSPALQGSTCNVANPKRYVEIPILTIAQFDSLKIFDKSLPPAQEQADAILEVNHTADGSVGLIYRIIRKVAERKI